MNRYMLFMALTAGILSAMFQQSSFGRFGEDEEVVDQNDVGPVKIELTHLDVNDTNLKLGFKIINDTDHDIWICDSVNTDGVRDFEVFMAEDNQTLVVRRRFDLNPDQAIFERFFKGRYIRFGPGQERTESLSFTIPPPRQTWFEGETGYAPYAKRLAIEIGYYNEDLRELLVNIINVGKKLDCDSDIFFSSFEEELAYYQFFGGFVIAEVFKSTDSSPRGSPVYDPVYDGGEEISMYHMGYVHMGEKVLRATINDVSIPCHLDPQSETEPADVIMALTGFDINDTKLELSWKIINNTEHDVWICDRLFPGDFFEWFLDVDDETLVIRRRFNLPEGQGWEHLPRACYIRLRPDQEKVDSISLSVPVSEHFHFGPLLGHGKSATRMALEIGFYDEDLPGLILQIVEMAENLNCDVSLDSPVSPSLDPDDKNMELSRRFFPGVFIARFFSLESFTFFRNSVTSGGDEIIIPYTYQTLNGELILRIEVDGVSIPLQRHLPVVE